MLFGGGSGTFLACAHGTDPQCQCAGRAVPASQNLDELDFARSACAAAQSGDCTKLQRIIARDPDAVHSDGAQGECWSTTPRAAGLQAPGKPSIWAHTRIWSHGA